MAPAVHTPRPGSMLDGIWNGSRNSANGRTTIRGRVTDDHDRRRAERPALGEPEPEVGVAGVERQGELEVPQGARKSPRRKQLSPTSTATKNARCWTGCGASTMTTGGGGAAPTSITRKPP